MTVYGGLRQRFVRDSLYHLVKDNLTLLGWFDANRQHKPINMVTKPIDLRVEIAFNTCTIVPESITEHEWELGSTMAAQSQMFYVDFYAESETIGQHFIGDVRDILAGRMPNINRTRPDFPVYDYRQATPPVLFYCDIEEIHMDRSNAFDKPWMEHWYACRFNVVDYY